MTQKNLDIFSWPEMLVLITWWALGPSWAPHLILVHNKLLTQ